MDKARVHFIGIGGIGMSGVARMFLEKGCAVQGSDLKKTEVLSYLEKLGAKIFVGHDASHVHGADTVVYSSSIPENHPERTAAVRNGARVLHRAQALAEVCEGKLTIAVTGTHGKTTTTALVGMVLKEASRDPSVVVGGLVNFFGGNAYAGRGSEIVVEADESDSSFLYLSPGLAVVTNIEQEHMDHFGTFERVRAAYRDFIGRLPEQGVWFGCSEDESVAALAGERLRRSVLYGLDPERSEIFATELVECPEGKRGVSFKVWRGGECLGAVHMNLIGSHNVLNALAAVGVGLELGISFPVIQKALRKYEGAKRRFDIKYQDPDYCIVDDYAHHPTEIRKTLGAAKALHPKRLFALFQPHRYTRTESLLKEFASSFRDADKLIVTEIYAAHEEPIEGVSGDRLCEKVSLGGHPDARFVRRSELLGEAERELRPGDLVVALGAGDISQVAEQLSDFLASRFHGQLLPNGAGSLFQALRGRVVLKEPLSKHSSLKVGGPVDYWVEPEDLGDLKTLLGICAGRGLRTWVLGAGSNVLPPDEGLEGVAIHLGATAYFKEFFVDGGHVVARAGLPNGVFIQKALEAGFGGFEFLSGVPGNIGGAIAMNAGSHGQSVDGILHSVKVVDSKGNETVLSKGEIPFAYRESGIRDAVIVEGVFRLPVRERALTQKRLDEYHAYRAGTQDLKHPSAGCMFKNPKDSRFSSGKLIEDAGLKGRKIGNAQVSMTHGNFIVNLGGARSRDVLHLIEEVRETVKAKSGVELEIEVKIL